MGSGIESIMAGQDTRKCRPAICLRLASAGSGIPIALLDISPHPEAVLSFDTRCRPARGSSEANELWVFATQTGSNLPVFALLIYFE
jgi:hypothetical protein